MNIMTRKVIVDNELSSISVAKSSLYFLWTGIPVLYMSSATTMSVIATEMKNSVLTMNKTNI